MNTDYLTELDFDNLPEHIHILNEYFVFVRTRLTEYHVDFLVYERMSWNSTDLDGSPLPDSVEIYLEGSIRCDGCSHIWLIDPENGDPQYKHICGGGSWHNMLEMYSRTYSYAMSLMPRAYPDELLPTSCSL